MENILIIGGGGHARVIASLLKKHADWNPIGYTDVTDKGDLLGLPYLGKDDILTNLIEIQSLQYAVIGLGQIKNIDARRKIINRIEYVGVSLPPIISPDAVISEDVLVGSGTVIMDGVIVQSGAHIGKCSIINTGAIIDHDCRIGDFVHVAPGVTLCGGVEVGNDVLVGAGASIIQGIIIGDKVIIAAGSAVVTNTLLPGTYAGVPARMLAETQIKEKND